MTPSHAATPQLPYRADIDGLRALAVLAVVGFHAAPKIFPGGFVGVDVFFVISGFLISGFILNRLKDGTFSYLEFYARRIRRLFPALIVVLLTTWGLGLLTLLPSELGSLGRHTLAAAAFAANILNYSEAGYFDAPAITKPLLHIWSLGVEEQFYFVYPVLLVTLWRHQAARSSLVMIGLASFALNVGMVHNHPSFTFYLPLTRFWEFVAGALLAWTLTHGSNVNGPARSGSWARPGCDFTAWAGLLLILAGIGVARNEAFPGWVALLPVLGTFFIIGAGPHAWLNRKVLAHPNLVFIGLISYPLYLWHWPLLVIGQIAMRNNINPHTRKTTIVMVGLAFLLAWLTYRFIERPIRGRHPLGVTRRIVAASMACMAAVGLLGFVAAQTRGFLIFYPALFAPITFGADYPPPNDDGRNSAGPLLMTFGDSNAEHLQPGLRRLQNERTFRFLPVNWGNCAPVGDIRRGDEDKCRELTAKNERLFEESKPDIVVIAALWPIYKHLERLADTLRFFQRIGVSRIIVIGTVPFWPHSSQTILFHAYRTHPLQPMPNRLFGFDEGTLETDRRVKEIASDMGANYISAYDVLCDQNGCLVRVGDRALDIVQVDRSHFSAAGSWFLIGHIANRIFD